MFPLRFDSDVLAMLQVQRPRGVLVFATSHEPHLVHNLKVIAAHSDCAHVVVASLVQPPVEEERLAYASLLATELQPVAVDIYRMQASALQLLKADEKVSKGMKLSVQYSRNATAPAQRVGLFLLTAPVCRSMAPLSLHRMGLLEVDANLKRYWPPVVFPERALTSRLQRERYPGGRYPSAFAQRIEAAGRRDCQCCGGYTRCVSTTWPSFCPHCC